MALASVDFANWMGRIPYMRRETLQRRAALAIIA
jgi:hypothetical protein